MKWQPVHCYSYVALSARRENAVFSFELVLEVVVVLIVWLITLILSLL